MSGKRGGFSYIFLLLAVVFLSLSFILINNITRTKRTAVKRDTKILEERNAKYSSAAESLRLFYEGHPVEVLPGGNLRIISSDQNSLLAFNSYTFEYAVACGSRNKPLTLESNVKIKGGIASSLPIYSSGNEIVVDALQRWSPETLFDKVDERFISSTLKYIKRMKEDDTAELHTVSRSYSSEGEPLEITGRQYYTEGARFGKNTLLNDLLIISDKALYFSENASLSHCNIYAPTIYLNGDCKVSDCEFITTGSLQVRHRVSINRTNIIALSLKTKKGFAGSSVWISDEASFHGNILLLPEKIDETEKDTGLKFTKGKKSELVGKVINYGSSDIKGNIDGSIYSGSFVSEGVEDTLSGVTVCRSIEPEDHFVFGIAEGEARVY